MKKLIVVAGLIIATACLVQTGPAAAEAGSTAAAAEAKEKVAPPKASMEAMSAEFMRKVMETSARIEAMKKGIADREQDLYENHPEVKAMRSQMVEIQKTINRLLDEDQELARLKMDRDILWSVMPVLPKPAARTMPPGMMKTP